MFQLEMNAGNFLCDYIVLHDSDMVHKFIQNHTYEQFTDSFTTYIYCFEIVCRTRFRNLFSGCLRGRYETINCA